MPLRITEENRIIDHALSIPEMVGFAIFNMDVPLEDGTTTPLWDIKATGKDTLTANRKRDKQMAAEEHSKRVELMANRVANGLTPFEGEKMPELDAWDEHDTPTNEANKPQDEWEHFWGGASPTEKLAYTLDCE